MAIRGASGDLTQGWIIPAKGENIRESMPGVPHCWLDEREGESCVFSMLGMCGGQPGCVSGFVTSF